MIAYQPMPVPDKFPEPFSGAREFVERNGYKVWDELFREFQTSIWINVTEVARLLPSLQSFAQPERYLRAVLISMELGQTQPPFEKRSGQLTWIKLRKSLSPDECLQSILTEAKFGEEEDVADEIERLLRECPTRDVAQGLAKFIRQQTEGGG